jgi:hypothetical protein
LRRGRVFDGEQLVLLGFAQLQAAERAAAHGSMPECVAGTAARILVWLGCRIVLHTSVKRCKRGVKPGKGKGQAGAATLPIC